MRCMLLLVAVICASSAEPRPLVGRASLPEPGARVSAAPTHLIAAAQITDGTQELDLHDGRSGVASPITAASAAALSMSSASRLAAVDALLRPENGPWVLTPVASAAIDPGYSHAAPLQVGTRSGLMQAEKSLKQRVRPYVIVGAIVGGVMTYFVMRDPCASGNHMCLSLYVSYMMIGSGTGGLAGMLVGYIRERR